MTGSQTRPPTAQQTFVGGIAVSRTARASSPSTCSVNSLPLSI